MLMGTEWLTIITGQIRQHVVSLFESQQIYNVIKRLRITLGLAALIWPRRPIKRANRPGGSSFDGS